MNSYLPEVRKSGVPSVAQPSYDQNFINKRRLGAVDGFAFEKLRRYPEGSTDIERKKNALEWVKNLEKMAKQAIRYRIDLRRNIDIDREVAYDLTEAENLKILEEVGWYYEGNFYAGDLAKNHSETAFRISVTRLDSPDETIDFIAGEDNVSEEDIIHLDDDVSDGELVYTVSFGKSQKGSKEDYYSYTYAATLKEAIDFLIKEFNEEAKPITFKRLVAANIKVAEERRRRNGRGRGLKNKSGRELWGGERAYKEKIEEIKRGVAKNMHEKAWNKNSIRMTVSKIEKSADTSTLHDTCSQYLIGLGNMLLKEARERTNEEKLARRLSDDNQIDLDSIGPSEDDFGIGLGDDLTQDEYAGDPSNLSHVSMADPMSASISSKNSTRDISTDDGVEEIDDSDNNSDRSRENTFDEIVSETSTDNDSTVVEEEEVIEDVAPKSVDEDSKQEDHVVIEHEDTQSVMESEKYTPSSKDIRRLAREESLGHKTFVAPTKAQANIAGAISAPVSINGNNLGGTKKTVTPETNELEREEAQRIEREEAQRIERERLIEKVRQLELQKLEEEKRLELQKLEEEKRLEHEKLVKLADELELKKQEEEMKEAEIEESSQQAWREFENNQIKNMAIDGAISYGVGLSSSAYSEGLHNLELREIEKRKEMIDLIRENISQISKSVEDFSPVSNHGLVNDEDSASIGEHITHLFIDDFHDNKKAYIRELERREKHSAIVTSFKNFYKKNSSRYIRDEFDNFSISELDRESKEQAVDRFNDLLPNLEEAIELREDEKLNIEHQEKVMSALGSFNSELAEEIEE